MAKKINTTQPGKIKKQPTAKQLAARAKFAEMAKNKNKKYSMEVKMNGEVFTCETKDLDEAIVALKPTMLKTRVIFSVKQGNKSCEKILFVPQAKQVFRNKMYRNVFIKRLIFK